MPNDAIRYAFHKARAGAGEPAGRFKVALDNLTKAEAADVLILLSQMQDIRAAGQEWTT